MGEKELEYFLKLYEEGKRRSDIKHSRWATIEECKILYNIVKKVDPGAVFECGTANGWTALWMAKAMHKDDDVYTFDIHDRPKIAKASNINYIVNDFSKGLGEAVFGLFISGKMPVVVFIDGDHKKEAVWKDTEAVMQHIVGRPGFKLSRLIYHDYRDKGVKAVVNKVHKMYPDWKLKLYHTHNDLAVFECLE